MALVVQWPGKNVSQCDIIHVLVLAGFVPSRRKAMIAVKSGWVSVDGVPVSDFSYLLKLDQPYLITVTFPVGPEKSYDVIICERMYLK